jgi:23S rRNA pseudouridine1911/1915/1917 synthase
VNAEILRTVVPENAPARLDVFLTAQFPDYSRTRIQQFIHEGRVSVDGMPAEKSGQPVSAGQQISMEIPPPVETALIGEKVDLQIVFENDNVLVIDKPAGMVVHPSYGHGSGTLVNAILGREGELPMINGEFRPGIVHRLDKETSGLILIAKNDRSLHFLQDQFKNRQVEKKYLALVDGHPPTPLGRVEAPIGRDLKNRKRMAVVEPGLGRDAVTEYRTLEDFQNHAFLDVHPLTGRTHQIRVHMKFLHCPVAGDTVYGLKKPSVDLHRHFLHATRLVIRLPGEDEPRIFEVALPTELQNVLEALRKAEKHSNG